MTQLKKLCALSCVFLLYATNAQGATSPPFTNMGAAGLKKNSEIPVRILSTGETWSTLLRISDTGPSIRNKLHLFSRIPQEHIVCFNEGLEIAPEDDLPFFAVLAQPPCGIVEVGDSREPLPLHYERQ